MSMEEIEVKEFEAAKLEDIEVPEFPKKKVHRFDLPKLEGELHQAYLDHLKEDDEQTRTNLFKTIRAIAHAILMVGKHSKKIEPEEAAYEYAVYLFERIITGTFKPDIKGGMPWQQYINLNVKHIVNSRKNESANFIELADDLELLINKDEQDTLELRRNDLPSLYKNELPRQLYEGLRIYYTREEIDRLLPLSLDLLHVNPKYMVNDKMPGDIKDFSIVMLSLAKRLAKDGNSIFYENVSKKELNKVLDQCLRSSIFLSSVIDTNFFPKELLLALDIDSLYRIVQISGGKKMRIPTQRELDTLIGAVVTVSKMITDGKDLKKTLRETKKDLDLVFSHQVNVQNFIRKIIDSIQLIGADQETLPLIAILKITFSNIDVLLDEWGENVDKGNIDPDVLWETRELVSDFIVKSTSILDKIDGILNK